mmetsp:Transcript_43225/g.93191  ORF Transcript_43225/g.93191 Transcript_43225/m.93191 type:complete len:484 (+) Transcript_43225:3-1454(+)
MAPESMAPADADQLGDDTSAGRRKKRVLEQSSDVPVFAPEKRLRMRAPVPVLKKYKGKKVNRKDVFGEEDDDNMTGSGTDIENMPAIVAPEENDDDDDEDEEQKEYRASSAGGFSISGALEAEYDRMMKKTTKEMEVMRRPSESELAKKEAEATRLKRQLDAWSALVEFRIHLEGALSFGHRLPVAEASQAFREGNSELGPVEDNIDKELSGIMGDLMALQSKLATGSSLQGPLREADSTPPKSQDERSVWNCLERRLDCVQDWSLDVADFWKSRTSLDVRKSFKVLDQSLKLQMQAVSEDAPERVRARCRPTPGKYQVFGARRAPEPESSKPSKEGSALAAADAEKTEAVTGIGEEDIFEDKDFYVQLLREVLSSGKSDLSDDTKNMQMELQGRRARGNKAAKANVDRKASKGRKIRYVPIEKLQNFMAPRSRASNGFLGVSEDANDDEDGESALSFRPSKDAAVAAMLRSLFAPDVGTKML